MLVDGDVGGGSVPRDSLDTLLAKLEDTVEEIVALDPEGLGSVAAAEVSVRVHRVVERLTGQRWGWLGQVYAEVGWREGGYRTFPNWIAGTHGIPHARAAREARAAKVVRSTLRDTGAAVRAGRIGTAQAESIVDVANTPERIDALVTERDLPQGAVPEQPRATGEQFLLALAGTFDVRAFAQIAKRFGKVADPEADDRGFKEATEREFFDVAKTLGGYHLAGFLTDEHGQALRTALRSIMGVPDSLDTRTPTQRRAAGLASLATVVLDQGAGSKVGGVRPHLSVHLSFTELHGLLHTDCQGRPRSDPLDGEDLVRLVTAPPAEWEDRTGPVPRRVLERIAQDCEVTRIVFGPDSQVIDVGRAQRTFTGQLRRAIVARDQVCVIRGCGAPAAIGEIHHAKRRWADGGTTTIDNGALTCAFHNQWLEDTRVPLQWVRGDQYHLGRWERVLRVRVTRDGVTREVGNLDGGGMAGLDGSRDDEPP